MIPSRQRPIAAVPTEDLQQGLEDEEPVSGLGEGDEIMEEVEEQEDGYSQFFARLLSHLRHLLLNYALFQECLLIYYPNTSIINTDINFNLDQLVLLSAWPRILLRSYGGLHRG